MIGTPVTLVSDGTYNAWPWVTAISASNYIAVYRTGATHTSIDGRVVYQLSTDAGATWGAKTAILTPAGGRNYDDASVVKTRTGRLFVNTFQDDGTNFYGINTAYSDNGGTSWAAGPTLTPYDTVQATSGACLQHSSGALIMPVYGKNSGDTDYRNGVQRSITDGLSFGGLITIGAQNSGYNEMTLIELPNGTIQAYVRNGASIYLSQSTDAGLTWSALAALSFTVAPGRPAAVVGSPDPVITLFYRQVTTQKPAWRSSLDSGVTWGPEFVYSNSVSQYSGGYSLGPSLFGLVTGLEVAAGDSRISFAPFSVA